MTRRKDPQPEAEPPSVGPPVDPPVGPPVGPPDEIVAGEPFVVTDPVDPVPPPPAEPPPPQVIVRRGSVMAPLIGGALAAIGGFALSHVDVLGLRPADPTAELAGLATGLAEVQTRISGLESREGDLAALSDRVAQLESAPAPPAPDLSRLDAFDQRLAAIEEMPTDGAASTAAVTAKLAELERRLAVLPQGASPELQQQLDAALARLDAAEAAAHAGAEEATVAIAAAQRTRALDALAARLSAGAAFGAELQDLDDPAVSQVLAAFAETGVPTLAQLQGGFPDAAREALRIARESGANEGWGGRLVDFLASQTGARPLTPLEGDTPDAILSRADFALSEGRVADAVAEVQPLDPAVKAALDPWLAQAQAHLSATAALQSARGE